MKKLYLFALAAMLFAACATDDTQDLRPMDAPETLTVGFEGGDDNTRVQLNEAGKTVWTKGDLVSVFYRSNANQKWQFQGETGERTGLLKRVSTPEATITLSDVVVAYPYSEEYYINPKTCNLQAYLPATQSYLKDSFGLDGNLMVSASEYNQIYLKNVCGWLKLQLTGEGEMVQSITLKGNNGEQVAGSIYVDTETATATLAAETNGGYEDGVGGTLVFDDTILTEVTLNCGNGVELGAGATTFYIALPPQTFEKGLTIEVACSDGSTMTKSTENAIAIERNCIQPMASVAYNGIFKPANNEIYYTNGSTTEATAPNKTDVFGANIVSNLYDAEKEHWVITFDSDVTMIGDRAFYRNKITSIAIPDSVTSIGELAFYYCTSLTSVTIPDSVTEIGYCAFCGCNSLTTVTIPDGVTTIGQRAFGSCKSLKTFYGKFASEDNRCLIVDGVLNSFAPAGITSYTIPDGVTEIGEEAFYSCASLTSVTIPDSVTKIGDSAFWNCTSLTSVTIPDSVTEMGKEAFYECTSLRRVDITDLSAWFKISFVNSSANPLYCGAKLYLNGSELTDITIPSDITEIKQYAFDNYSSLTSVTIPDSVTSIGSGAFYYCTSLTSVTIGNGVTEIGSSAFLDCTSLKAFYGKFATTDNRCLIVNGTLNAFAIGCGATSYTIPDSVTSIGYAAFADCSSLTSVNIPDSVTSIGDYVFYGCTSLTSVNIPDSVTSIGDYVFYGCTSLTSVTIPDSVTKIGHSAFWNCSSLTSVNIPDSVTGIRYETFRYCSSLTSITIPDSVTSIGHSAFLNCTSLKTVYCKPTTPPTGGSSMFSSNATGRRIFVPASADDSIINAYKAKSYWRDYADYIFEYDFSAEQ